MTSTLLRPQFIIIGAMKCGTTTLARTLDTHPEIGMSRDKETDFFVEEINYKRGFSWYSAQFNPAFRVHGEASPNYTKAQVFAGVPARIAADCPGIKLIYLVRDPVARLVSQYRHSWTMGELFLTPEEFMADAWEFGHAIDVSCYYRQIAAFLEHFPLSDIKIIDFDTLLKEPEQTIGEVQEFIGVSLVALGQPGHFNDSAKISRIPKPLLRLAQSAPGRAATQIVGRQVRDRIRDALSFGNARQPPAIPPEMHKLAAERLRDDVAEFRKLTGQPFSHWTI